MKMLDELKELAKDMEYEIDLIDNFKKYTREDFSKQLTFYKEWLERIIKESENE